MRSALVVGASSGIGLACVQRLDGGFRVFAASRTPATLPNMDVQYILTASIGLVKALRSPIKICFSIVRKIHLMDLANAPALDSPLTHSLCYRLQFAIGHFVHDRCAKPFGLFMRYDQHTVSLACMVN